MSEKRPPKDSNQLAKYIVDVTSGEAEEDRTTEKESSRAGAFKTRCE